MLHPDERPLEKLAAVRDRLSRDTLAAQRKHLKRITRAFSEIASPLSGSLEQRLAGLYRTLLATARRVA